MRTIQRLSYSGFSLWEKNQDEFYLKYLSNNRSPRIPQERPAAAGSVFDARVKSALHADLFGAGSDPKYSFEALFESQVEPQNRDWALGEVDYIFDAYRLSGFYSEILTLLKAAKKPPRFEFTVDAVIDGVPFTGKPDCQFVTEVDIVHDWKLSGYCSKSATSPHPSYMLCRDGYDAIKHSKSHGTEHEKFIPYRHGGMTVNKYPLETSNTAWADQLSLYGWALGEKIGDDDVVMSIHQIVAKPTGYKPLLRVAGYRARVSSTYQVELAARIKRCWAAITSGHIFPDLTKAVSDARCETLDSSAVGLQSDGSSREDFFHEITRSRYRG
jgi:hypothetical protein